MTPGRQKTIKELYSPKDIVISLAAIACSMVVAVAFANFASFYSGI